MNISGIRPGIGFSEYNDIKIQQPKVNPAVTSEQPVQTAPATTSVKDEDIAAAKEKQTFSAYDFANQYKPGVSYSMKGAESDIKSLDVEKAVNDMEKDSALRQYQYFVGSQPTESLADVAIRGAENFTL